MMIFNMNWRHKLYYLSSWSHKSHCSRSIQSVNIGLFFNKLELKWRFCVLKKRLHPDTNSKQEWWSSYKPDLKLSFKTLVLNLQNLLSLDVNIINKRRVEEEVCFPETRAEKKLSFFAYTTVPDEPPVLKMVPNKLCGLIRCL